MDDKALHKLANDGGTSILSECINRLVLIRTAKFAEYQRLRAAGIPWSNLIQLDQDIAWLDKEIGRAAGLMPAKPILIGQ